MDEGNQKLSLAVKHCAIAPITPIAAESKEYKSSLIGCQETTKFSKWQNLKWRHVVEMGDAEQLLAKGY